MRVNLGSGPGYLDGWLNVDERPTMRADVRAGPFEFLQRHGREVAELWLGDLLDRLPPADVRSLLDLVVQRLPAGAEVSAAAPDVRALLAAHAAGDIDDAGLDEILRGSPSEPGGSIWCHDAESLVALFEDAGFEGVRPVDPARWPPVFDKVGPRARFRCAVRGAVPAERPAAAAAATGAEPGVATGPVGPAATGAEPGVAEPPAAAPASPEELLLTRVERLRRALERESAETALARQRADESEALREEVRRVLREMDELRSSRTFRTAQRFGRLTAAILPPGSQQRRVAALARVAVREARQVAGRLRREWAGPEPAAPVPTDYDAWSRQRDVVDPLDAQRAASREASHPVRFAVVVDATGPAAAPDLLAATLASLVEQSWGWWEATVVHDPVAVAPPVDARISLQAAGPSGPAGAAHLAVDQQEAADFAVFLQAGDSLAADAFHEIARTAGRDPLLELIYWDDDLVDEAGRRRDPRFRPSWSPETLLGANYLGRSFALHTRRYAAAGGLRAELGRAARWDLLLRAGVPVERVARIPRVLGHLRQRDERAGPEGVRAVADHLRATGRPATAEAAGDGVRVRWRLERWPPVSVVIPTRHNRPMLERCLPSLATTDYPGRLEVVLVDNGSRTEENEAWYAGRFAGLDLAVEWWDQPFNYSAVNNRAVTRAGGEVLVFLNDDTEVLHPDWLCELVGWARQPEIGAVGPQLLGPDGRLQFAGTVVGLGGFADHLFQGLEPGSATILGPTGWYRDVLAVTGACLAVRREAFEQVGGFDERFVLCGSDVALGLDLTLAGLRNLCTPFSPVRHLESATRGTRVPARDFYTSYWRYHSWLLGGDPYFSPNLSLTERVPTLREPADKSAAELVAPVLQRRFHVFRQTNATAESFFYADDCRATEADVRAVAVLHEANRAPFEPETVNWLIPDIDSPFYGGINTAFRIAEHLARNHGVANRFLVWGPGPEAYVRSGMGAAFPALADSPVFVHDGTPAGMMGLPEADVSIATLWVTAYQLAHFAGTRRKFYLIQDFEPLFHPAGTMYALAEESYRLGLYGLCNSPEMRRIYREEYGGRALGFVPAVDTSIFHAEGRVERPPDEPVTIFVYARPGHWRNCWEIAGLALKEVKQRLGDRVRILAAGSWAGLDERDLDSYVRPLGLLDYRATGPLYRTCDIGLALTVSKHPSYLPLELMACGAPSVAFDSPHFRWLLRDGENCLLTERTVDAVADALERLVVDPGLRRRLARQGLADIAANHASWEKALAGIYSYLSDPEGVG